MRAAVIRVEDYIIDWAKARGLRENSRNSVFERHSTFYPNIGLGFLENARILLDFLLDVFLFAVCSKLPV
jgi:hypothetical protein